MKKFNEDLTMKSLWLGLAGLVFSSVVFAQAQCPAGQVWDDCDGPAVGGTGPCIPGCKPVGFIPPPPAANPVGPARLCFPEGCFAVRYRIEGPFVIAESSLPDRYRVMGWAGPCLGAISTCSGIGNQAFSDLRETANRLYRYGRDR